MSIIKQRVVGNVHSGINTSHTALSNRDVAEQHPVEAISGLSETLKEINKQTISLQNQLDQESSKRLQKDSELVQDIQAERNRATKAEQDLNSLLIYEQNRAKDTEQSLARQLATETSRALRAEGLLTENLAAEKERSILTDKNLGDRIKAETSRASEAEDALDAKLDAEIARASEEELNLNSKINSENIRAEQAEGSLHGALNDLDSELQEFSSKTVQDFQKVESDLNTLDEKIDTVQSDLSDKVSDTENNLLSLLNQQDEALKTLIQNEQTRAEFIEGELDRKLQEEFTRATGAESELNQKINAEATRALAAESNLNDKLDTEKTRALAAEQDLIDTKVDQTSAANKVYGTNDAGEQTILAYSASVSNDTITRRTSDGRIKAAAPRELSDLTTKSYVDEQLASRVKTEENRAIASENSLESRIESLEARGRFLSNWSAATGIPATYPEVSPYLLKSGDYFIINNIGTVNYMPEVVENSGKYYYESKASTTIIAAELGEGDYFIFEGTKWLLTQNTQKTVTFAQIAGAAKDNLSLKAEFEAINNQFEDLDTTKVDKVTGKSLIADTEITRLSEIEDEAQVNKIESIKLNNTTLPINNKQIDLGNLASKEDLLNSIDNITELISTEAETDRDKLSELSGAKKSDIAIIKRLLSGTSPAKYSYTGYAFDGTNWKALDGNYSADNVYFTENLIYTKAFGELPAVGASGFGTIAAKGKNITTVLTNIMAKKANPTVTTPTLTFYNIGSIINNPNHRAEVGTIISETKTLEAEMKTKGSYTYGPSITDNISTGWNTSVSVNKVPAYNINKEYTGTEKQSSNLNFNYEIQYADTTYTATFYAKFDYSGSAIYAKDNLGNQTEIKLSPGSVDKTATATYAGYRNMFYGTLTDKTTELTSSVIRQLPGTEAMKKPNNSLALKVPVGALRVVIAVPNKYSVTSIKDRNGMTADILSSFTTLTDVDVKGANNYTAIKYNVYYLDYASENDTENYYDITIV